jgi:predicted short-subunit dehydrogenase-like oxidoreductase (DUF2520 family)
MNGDLPQRLSVAIIGPGRAGTAVGVALVRAGHRVVAVGGGSEASRTRFMSYVAGARGCADVGDAVTDTGLVVLAVPDDAITDVVTTLAVDDRLREGMRVIHLSGAAGLEPLRRATLAGCMTAALHPAQSLTLDPFDPEALIGAAWAVTARERDRGWASALVTQLGGDPHDVGDDRRVLYHAALAVGSNVVGAAVAMARQLLIAARVDDPAAFLAPLVENSTANALRGGAKALTGPVVRADVGTLAAHLRALEHDVPHLAPAYRELQRAVVDLVAPTLTDEQVAAVRAVLADPEP